MPTASNNQFPLTPLGRRVIIRPVQSEEVTRFGIILPENARDRSCRGVVLSTGPQVSEICPGDQVVYSPYAGTEINIRGEKCLIFAVGEIFARVTGGLASYVGPDEAGELMEDWNDAAKEFEAAAAEDPLPGSGGVA